MTHFSSHGKVPHLTGSVAEPTGVEAENITIALFGTGT